MLRIFVLILILTIGSQANFDKDQLITKLFQHYVKVSDPGAIDLQLGLAYVCARQERNAYESHDRVELNIKLWENYNWKDTRLSWDPSDHGNVDRIRVPASMVWTPDFKQYNAHSDMENRDDVNVLILADGSITWVPPVTYKTYCSGSKHESITCSIKLGPWTYSDKDIKLSKGEFQTESSVKHCPYTISEPTMKVVTKTYPCCPDEPYSHIDTKFTLNPAE